jgi:hypothetical protein
MTAAINTNGVQHVSTENNATLNCDQYRFKKVLLAIVPKAFQPKKKGSEREGEKLERLQCVHNSNVAACQFAYPPFIGSNALRVSN